MSEGFNPLQLPSVNLSELNKLPECTAIYFAIDAEDRFLYVGKATNLATRWKTHHRKFQLKEINDVSPVRISWIPWNQEDLNQAEKYFIKVFQPLLNTTRVKFPDVVPSERILREFLLRFSKQLIILGSKIIKDGIPEVYLKYDWTKVSRDTGTTTKIKQFIQETKNKNTGIKFKWKRYIKIRDGSEYLRPGSRDQKTRNRRYSAYNNYWQVACNGVFLHITPAGNDYHDVKAFKTLKKTTQFNQLAGIKIRAVTQEGLSAINYKDDYFFSGISCYERDLIPLLWTSYE